MAILDRSAPPLRRRDAVPDGEMAPEEPRPFRFEQAFRRARRKVELERVESVQAQIRTLLAGAAPPAAALPSPPPRYLERIAVPMRGKTRVVPVAEIDYVTASGTYSQTHVVREPLQALEEQLDPEHFLRIHRSAIVRVSLIDTLLRGEGGDYHLQLKTGVRLKVSRYRREELERRIGKRP